MGCKESKHKAVAEGNTIIAPSSGRKSTNRGQNVNDKNNAQSLQRSRSGRMQKQESSKKINVGDSKVTKENENLGNDNGAVNVNAVLEKENKRLKKLNDQIVKDNNNVGDEANIKKENQNNNVVEERGKENILVPKVNLLSSSRKDGESIEAIISDGMSGTSAYYTPTTEVAGALEVNTKTENSDEQKKEPVEEIKDVKTGTLAFCM